MGKSSKDKRDAYYRLAKEQGWRARSAFKLLQLDQEFDLFSGVTRVVDLCAAPGSWSQVLSRVLIQNEKFGRSAWEDKEAHLRRQILGLAPSPDPAEQAAVEEMVEGSLARDAAEETAARPGGRDVKIVSIDLQPISPLAGITTLRADITHPATIPLLFGALDKDHAPGSTPEPVDLVLSDGAPDVTGLHDLDIYIQSQLLTSALNLTLCILRPGGTFLAKIFRGRNVDVLYAQLKVFFDRVTVAKPRSSRASSVEAFIVCQGFRPPAGFRASLENPLSTEMLSRMTAAKRMQLPVLAEGRMQSESGCWDVEVDAGHDDADAVQERELGSEESWIAPFVACGDLSGFDSDASYTLPEDHVSLEPVQPPIAPPYKRALEMRAAMSGAKA